MLGLLCDGLVQSEFDSVSALQIQSWQSQLLVLQNAVRLLIAEVPSSGSDLIILEYVIPVLRRRIDCVLLSQDKVFVIEYKGGATTSAKSAVIQVTDYALDLGDFHEHCRSVQIFALALGQFSDISDTASDKVRVTSNSQDLFKVLFELISREPIHPPIHKENWRNGRYFPVPHVVQAAVSSFNNHDVAELAHSRADKGSLSRTVDALVSAVSLAQKTDSKHLLVVTGVPGAGKTLAGLLAVSQVTEKLDISQEQATYLSGNIPLVRVIREALYRDRKEKEQARSVQFNRRTRRRDIENLVHEMHRFVTDSYGKSSPPVARMIVFDEAQRAWSQTKNLKKFQRDVSEPEMVIDMMDKHDGWAVVVALVGGGQEIHDGEAGLEAWGTAVLKFPEWRVWSSQPAILGGPSVAGSRLFPANVTPPNLEVKSELHLDVSFRALNAESSAGWVNAILDGRISEARTLSEADLPIVRTRNLETARNWLKEHQLGSRRVGLVASSAAERLRSIGVETPTFSFMQGIDYVRWFLDPAGDIRSSNQLEVALSEFEVQGLELDYVGLVWGGDLLFDDDGPVVRKFSGSAWQKSISKSDLDSLSDSRKRQYQEGLNRYRVLMTRFRSGMVIYVPPGNAADETVLPQNFDLVFQYLEKCGIRSLD